MAIFQTIFTAIGRQAGKLLNMIFAWATIMIFGKVPEGRQTFVSIMGLGSIVWLICVIGILVPSVATFLLGFVTLPNWVDDNMVRLAMLLAALLVPAIVGVISLFLLDPGERPRGGGDRVRTVLKGYRFTPGLATTMLLMVIFAPILKMKPLIRRWTSQHVPMIVEERDYLGMVLEIQRALQVGGWKTQPAPASWMLRFPTKVFTVIGGGDKSNLVADNLMVLQSPTLEVALHPSDLVIGGKKADVAHARATIAEQLAFSKAYMTWNKEANELEDRLTALWNELRARGKPFARGPAANRLQHIERDLKALEIPYEEWEVLNRKKLLTERGMLQLVAGLSDRPLELTEVAADEAGAAQVPTGSTPRRLTPRLAALALAAGLVWLRLRPKTER
jgi:hypothetical protein